MMFCKDCNLKDRAIIIPKGATNEEIIKTIFPEMPRQVIWSINTMMEAETKEDWAQLPYGGEK